MARCHLNLVVMLIPLWPAAPGLAQSARTPEGTAASTDRPDLIVRDDGAVTRSSPPPPGTKNTDRVPQSSAPAPSTDVQLVFAPATPSAAELSSVPASPCSIPANLSPSEAEALVRRIAEQERFYPDFVVAVARQESRFKTDALSQKGAYGLMQLMPATAKRFDVDRCVPEANVRGGIRFLRELHQRYRNPLYVLAAYNAGETALQEHGGIPPFAETVAYVAAVLNDFYGYPGIKDAEARTINAGAASARANDRSVATQRRSRQTDSAAKPTRSNRPDDWLVLHVE